MGFRSRNFLYKASIAEIRGVIALVKSGAELVSDAELVPPTLFSGQIRSTTIISYLLAPKSLRLDRFLKLVFGFNLQIAIDELFCDLVSRGIQH